MSNLTISSLIKWLGEQPADGSYEWCDVEECAMAKYLRDMTGDPRPAISYEFWNVFGPNAYDEILFVRPWTFGKALSRAKQWKRNNA